MCIYLVICVCVSRSACVIHSPRTSLETALSHLTPPRTRTHPHTYINTKTFMCTCLRCIYTYFLALSNTKVNNDNSYHLHNLGVSCTHTNIYTHVSPAYVSFCIALLLLTFLLSASFLRFSVASFRRVACTSCHHIQAFWRRCHSCYKLQLCLKHLLI